MLRISNELDAKLVELMERYRAKYIANLEQHIELQRQLEQWYLSLLHDGRVPEALINADPLSKRMSRPRTAYTKSLREDAMARFPRLRGDLSDNQIEEFMTDAGWPKAHRFRDNRNNGWTFEPLIESRAAWDQRYGPQSWNEMTDWDPTPTTNFRRL